MTITAHSPDWKVTPAHKVLIGVGWTIAMLALAFGAAAVVLDMPRLWGAVAGLAVFAMGLGLTLPEPVPGDMLTGTATRVDARRA